MRAFLVSTRTYFDVLRCRWLGLVSSAQLWLSTKMEIICGKKMMPLSTMIIPPVKLRLIQESIGAWVAGVKL
jgi:hypothetical protein